MRTNDNGRVSVKFDRVKRSKTIFRDRGHGVGSAVFRMERERVTGEDSLSPLSC